MMSPGAPLCVSLLLAAAGFIATDQHNVKYIPLEGSLELPVDGNSTTVKLYKTGPSDKQPDLVERWVGGSPLEVKVSGTYGGRTELDKETGVIVIKNMTIADSGRYFMVEDGKSSQLYWVEVIKSVPKPSVVIKPLCSRNSTTCSLVCEGNITDSGPVTYRWKKDGGEWMESGQNWTITNDEEWKKVEKVFCEMKNPVSVEQSDPWNNPFYRKGNTPVSGIIGTVIVVGLMLAVALVLGVKCCDDLNDILTLRGLWPVHDLEVLTTTSVDSSSRNGKEVPLLQLKISYGSADAAPNVPVDTSSPGTEKEDSTLSRAPVLYSLCEKAAVNQKRCRRLSRRMAGLEELVLMTAKRKGDGQNPADVEKARRDLKNTLDSAIEVVEKYTSGRFHEHMSEDSGRGDEFEGLNDSLNKAFVALSPNLLADHDLQTKLEKLFCRDSQQEEDEADRKEDCAELQKIKELIDPIMPVATSLYTLCEEVKGNKKQCQRLAQRVKGLEELVMEMKQKGAGQISADVEKALRELKKTLESATKVVDKYTSDSFHEHVFKDYNDNTEFGSLNRRLYDTFNKLSQALQVDHNHELHKLFNEASQPAEDEADRKEDHAELKRIMDLLPVLDREAASLSPLCKGAVFNKDRRKCLVQHVDKLKNLLGAIKEKGPGQNSAVVEEALRELKTTLTSAETAAFVENYSKFKEYGKEYNSLNNRLDSALDKLSRALLVDQ